MSLNKIDKKPVSIYKVIFSLDDVNEEELLYIENRINSSGYAKLNPETNYDQGIRTWLLD